MYDGSNMPTPSELYGAKISSPLEASTAPQNLPFELIVALASMTVNNSLVGSNTPTLSAL